MHLLPLVISLWTIFFGLIALDIDNTEITSNERVGDFPFSKSYIKALFITSSILRKRVFQLIFRLSLQSQICIADRIYVVLACFNTGYTEGLRHVIDHGLRDTTCNFALDRK